MPQAGFKPATTMCVHSLSGSPNILTDSKLFNGAVPTAEVTYHQMRWQVIKKGYVDKDLEADGFGVIRAFGWRP